MYKNTTTEFNNILTGDSRTFKARMICGDEMLTGFHSIKISAQANEDTNTISIGGAVSSFIEVSMDKPVGMVTGKEYQLDIGLLVSDAMEWAPMGVFTPQSPKEEDGLLAFTAYDRMVSKLSGAYFTDITAYPADGKTILQEIATKAGITVNLSGLPDGIMVDKRTATGDSGTTTVNPFDGYTYREAVKYLAQMYGCFATFDRTGKLEFRWYTESGYSTSRVYSEPESQEKIYQLQKITCNVNGTALAAGSGTTGITIENPVMTQAILDSVYTKIGGMQYLPTTASFFGDIRLDLGDIVTVQKRDGTAIKVPVMSLSQEFDGGVITAVGSYGNTEEEEGLPKGPTATALDRVYTELFLARGIIAGKVNTDILEANYATITQLNAVDARIDKIISTEITTKYLEANYAQIDMANVDTAVIRQGFLENLMVSQGIIADRVVGSEVVATHALTGVSVYANDITAGTLSVERLILRGSEDSLVYALNNSGGLESTVVDTINGGLITEKTITADHIVAGTITSTEIDVADLVSTGLIGANKLTATNIDVADLFAQNITASGSIQSSNYVAGTSGMKLTMSTGQWDSKYFKVGSDGKMTATGGTIGGFDISKTCIATSTAGLGGADDNIYIGTDGISCGTKFKVDKNGTAVAANLKMHGSVYTNGIYMPVGVPPVGSLDPFVSYTSVFKPVADNLGEFTPTFLVPIDFNQGITVTGNICESGIPLSYKYQAKGSYAAASHTHTPASIGAAAASHTHPYLPLSGGTITGNVIMGATTNADTMEFRQNVVASNVSYNGTVKTYNSGTMRVGLYDRTNSEWKSWINLNADGTTDINSLVNIKFNKGLVVNGVVRPETNSSSSSTGFFLGSSSYKWRTVYAYNGSINTSDRNEKHDILYDLDGTMLEAVFDDLKPVTYVMNSGDRTHIGVIAQDVEETIQNHGYTIDDLAFICRDQEYIEKPNPDGEGIVKEYQYNEDGTPKYIYGIRYGELSMLSMWQTQKLKKRVIQLEQQIQNLTVKLNSIVTQEPVE